MNLIFRDNLDFKYSTDIQFYGCNLLHWRDKISEIGLNIPLDIDNSQVQFCTEFLSDTNKGFTSGPIFPALLYINQLFENNLFIKLIFISLLFTFIFLSFKTSILKSRSQKLLILFLLILSPSLLWLTIFPSTDLINAVFWLVSIFSFKNYINSNIRDFELKNIQTRSIYYLIPFALSLIFSILTRPSTTLVISTIIIWMVFDIIWIVYRKNFRNLKLLSIILNTLLLFLIIKLNFIFYAGYGTVLNKYQIYFYSWSPPGPIGLREAINLNMFDLFENFDFIINQPITWFNNFLKFILLVITNFIFGTLSLAGIQISEIVEYNQFPNFKILAAIFKSLYGFLFILPGIFSLFFLNTKKLFSFINNPKSKIKRIINFVLSEDYYMTSISLIIILHIIISLCLVSHIRYLTPVIPFILSFYIIHNFNKNYL